ncbi:MAG: AAA family ATPase [Leptospiraceae bacterium]|nr:AAA family ATPase [Leptospiraceae bacterium]
MSRQSCRVVLTGGPGGGKTTAADLYRREIGDEVVIVPEAATLLYVGGFPRTGKKGVRRATQRAIYHVQKNLEEAHAEAYRSRVLLCDRGTIDGAAYWPGDPMLFFKHLETTLERELARYDAVIFFETAAVGGISIEGGNPARIESLPDAVMLDRRLRELWSRHPHYVLVPHQKSFIHKVNKGLEELAKVVAHYRQKRMPT